MFIKHEYDQSLSMAVQQQIKAVFSIHDLMNDITDDKLFEQLKCMCQRQAQLYYQYKNLTDKLSKSEHEKRVEKRENSLGVVKLQEEVLGDVGIGKCLDISTQGVRLDIDSTENINVGRKMNLWIELFDQDKLLQRQGVVRWAKKIADAKYLCGLKFC